MIGRRLPVSAAHHHSVAVADAAVTRRAVNIEALLPALQIGARDGKRKIVDIFVFQLSREASLIDAQKSRIGRAQGTAPSRNSACDIRPRGTPVAEEVSPGKGLVARLIVHILSACGSQK